MPNAVATTHRMFYFSLPDMSHQQNKRSELLVRRTRIYVRCGFVHEKKTNNRKPTNSNCSQKMLNHRKYTCRDDEKSENDDTKTKKKTGVHGMVT